MNSERDARERRERRDVQETRGLREHLARPTFRACLALHAAGSVAARLYIMVVFAGVAFLLHGCKMGPDYTYLQAPRLIPGAVGPRQDLGQARGNRCTGQITQGEVR